MEENKNSHSQWQEADSAGFIELSEFVVPERQIHLDIFTQLLAATPNAQQVVDICCGEGRIGEALVQQFPQLEIWGLDGSDVMLEEAHRRLAGKGHFKPLKMDISDQGWRGRLPEVDAVFSSLAIHHLDGPGKQQLFRDVFTMLRPSGVFAILDIVAPTHATGRQIAANQWDKWVNERSGGTENAIFRKFSEEGWNYFSDPEPDVYDQPSSLADQLKWMQTAGFEQVDVYWMKAGHALFGGWKKG